MLETSGVRRCRVVALAVAIGAGGIADPATGAEPEATVARLQDGTDASNIACTLGAEASEEAATDRLAARCRESGRGCAGGRRTTGGRGNDRRDRSGGPHAGGLPDRG